jgi:hypothetical protein
MQSPFDFFRKNQKLMMVSTIGLAMFGFVVAPAITDPSNMSPFMGALFIACSIGAVAWIAGARSKKSNEYGLVGFIAGLGIGLAAMMAVGPGDVVRADTGNIDQMEMNTLFRQRGLANQFVGMAYGKAQENGFQAFSQPFRFGFGHPDESRDIVVGELLRREADRIGMEVTDEAVNDFIRSEFDGKIGGDDVRELRRQIGGVSESELYQALRNELMAYNAGRFFYGGITVANGRNPLPPLEYWEFYRKMNIQQSVGVVPLPVAAFVDESATPGDAELQELFAQHKANFPNTTLEGRLEEGLIGFRQPRRVALEYIEIPYEAVEKTVGEVTDEEIEQYYEEYYASAPDMPASGSEQTPPADGPMLPDMGPDEVPATDDKPQPSTDAPPADDKPAEPDADDAKPAETPQEPATETKPESPAEQPKAVEPPADSEDESPADGTAPSDSEAAPTENQSGASLPSSRDLARGFNRSRFNNVRRSPALQQVAFFDDEAPAEQPAESPAEASAAADDAPAQEQPAADTPAEAPSANDTPAQAPPTPEAGDAPASPTSETPQPPAADAPANEAEMPAEPAAPAEGDAPAEPSGPRELDDELREEIRDQILRRKTSQKQQELMRQAYELMGIELSSAIALPEDDDAYVSADAAAQRLQEFARQKGLLYERTPLLTLRELEQSEEHPVGRASSVANIQSVESAAQIAFSMAPGSLHQARQVMDIETGSRFVFWKVEDVASYVPERLDDPGIREQVVKVWRQIKAREKAQARAEELAKQADGTDTPLSEIFAGTTVTGKEGADAVSVVQPPTFSWLSAPNAQMSPNPFNRPTPTMTELRTVPGDVGEEFMRTVFDRLDPGEAGVAHSYDMEYFYVVKILDRSYGNAPDQQTFRERFASQPVFDQFGFSDYFKLAARELAQYQTNWADELFERHNVEFAETDRTDGEES